MLSDVTSEKSLERSFDGSSLNENADMAAIDKALAND